MTTAVANGIQLEYEVTGDGEPLLLIMGLSGQLIDWPDAMVTAIADQGFRVIRFDNRDSGLSQEFSGTPSLWALAKTAILRRSAAAEYLIDDMAADALGLLDVLGIDRAHVVGFSMGGMIAQAVAINAPERTLSLASISSTTGNRRVGAPRGSLLRAMLRQPVPSRTEGGEAAIDAAVSWFQYIAGPTFDPDEFRVQAKAAVERSYRPTGVARQLAAILGSPDRTRALRRLDVPAVVIHGMLDPLVRPSGGLATARAIRSSRLIMFNDMGHDLPSTRWTEIAEALRRNADRATATTTHPEPSFLSRSVPDAGLSAT